MREVKRINSIVFGTTLVMVRFIFPKPFFF